jgi:hypothetical protein
MHCRMKIVNLANIPVDQLASIEAEIAPQQNLQDLMRWARADRSGVFQPGVVADVVVQDEYTHDVVVPWREGLVLVYDTT